MRWTEVIGVRASAGHRRTLAAQLRRLQGEVQEQGLARSMRVLQRLAIDTDLCVYLEHDTRAADPAGSAVAQRLVEEMRPFGLVHHSIWIEAPAP